MFAPTEAGVQTGSGIRIMKTAMMAAAVLLTLLLLSSVSSEEADARNADTVFTDSQGIEYSLFYWTPGDPGSGVAKVTDGRNASGEVTVTSPLKIDGYEYNIDSIEDYAFLGNQNMTKLTIVNNYNDRSMTIVDGAFRGCTGLTDIVIKNGTSPTYIRSSAFEGCSGVKNITVPVKDSNIEGALFRDMVNLESVTIDGRIDVSSGSIGKQLVNIGGAIYLGKYDAYGVFKPARLIHYCDSPERTSFDMSLDRKMPDADGTMVTVKTSEADVDDYAFANSRNLTSITLPYAQLPVNTFKGCVNIIEADLTQYCEFNRFSDVPSFSSLCISQFTGLKTIALNSDVGYYVGADGMLYYENGNKTEQYLILCPAGIKADKIRIPDSIDTVNNYAFNNVSTELFSPGASVNWNQSEYQKPLYGMHINGFVVEGDAVKRYTVNNGGLYYNEGTILLKQADGDKTKALLLDGVRKVHEYAFQDCVNIEEVTFAGKNVTFHDADGRPTNPVYQIIGMNNGGLPNNAFLGCKNLKKVMIPDDPRNSGYRSACDGRVIVDISDNNQTSEIKGYIMSYVGYGDSSDLVLPDWIIGWDNGTNRAAVFDSDCRFQKITLSDNMELIPTNSFNGLPNLNQIIFGDKLASISSEAIVGCNALNTFTVPSTLTRIGENAFMPTDADGMKIILGAEADSVSTHMRNVYFEADPANKTYISGPGPAFKEYTVKFIIDGHVYRTDYIRYNYGVNAPEVPLEYTADNKRYTVTQWEGLTDSYITVTGNTEYNAVCTYVQVNMVTFDPDNGNPAVTVGVEHGKVIDADKIPSTNKTGASGERYTFIRWEGFDPSQPVTADVTCKALYKTEYQVKFTMGSRTVYDEYLEAGTVITAPVADPDFDIKKDWSRVTYVWDTFTEGMTADAPCTFSGTAVEEFVMHFTDIFADTQYTLVKKGDVIPAATPAHTEKITEGVKHTFSGWLGFTEGMTADKHYEFGAMYEEAYEIRFTACGKDFQPPVFVNKGDVITAPATEPTKTGPGGVTYTFSEWKGFTEGMKATAPTVFNALFDTVFEENSGEREGNNISFTAEESESATIPFGSTEGSDNVSVKMDTGSVSLDREALTKVGATEKVRISKLGKEALTPEMQKLVGDCPVVEISVGDVHDFGNGKLTITLKYDLASEEDPNNIRIWHFRSDGTYQEEKCTYNPTFKQVTFQVSSLSKFAVKIATTFNVGVDKLTEDGGYLEFLTPHENLNEGDTVRFKITTEDGYQRDKFRIVNLGLYPVIEADGTCEFVMPNRDVTIEYGFSKLPEPTPEPSGGEDDKGGSNMGLYIGAAVAVLAVIGIAFFMMKRKA